MKKAGSSTARSSMPRSNKSSPQILSNNENDAANIVTPSDNDYPNHHFSHKQQQQQQHRTTSAMNNHSPQNPLPSNYQTNNNVIYQQQQRQGNMNNHSNTAQQQQQQKQQQSSSNTIAHGSSQQYIQINQGGQIIHTMSRQQQQQQQQQYTQQRQDVPSGGHSRRDLNNHGNSSSSGGGGGGSSLQQLEMDRAALTQKNHRLAKELSDLRVKHREETKVVSRLTMENMNLASRCRQAISEAADLKRKVVAYEKRHSEFGNLQKEVLLLRRQIEKQHGGNGIGGNGVDKSGGKGGGGGTNHRSISPKKPAVSSSSSNNTTPVVDEKKKKRASAAAATTTASTLETKGSEETLDRIMAQELFKNKNNGGAVDAAEKKDGIAVNANAVTKKFQELNISTTTTTNSSTSNNKPGGGSNSKVISSSTTLTNNATSASSSKRSNTTTATTTSSATDGTNNNNNISSANTKIPISVTTNSTTQKDDDEFDAEIDMVDFFAKSSATKLGSTSSSSANINSGSSNSNGVDNGIPASSSRHTRSHITHKLKKTETDDHMPEELVGPTDGALLSPSSKSKKNVGDNLLSSLDAFEASFASAFPETSFSIKGAEAPSSTELDMSFDVPVFDPFFKSPVSKDRDGAATTSSAALSSSLQSSPPKSKSVSSSSGGASATTAGSGSNPHKDGMKSQLKDLFPDSALTTSPKRGLDLTFDSTFADVDIGSGSSSNNKSGKGKSSSLSADKLDSAFSRAHSTTPTRTASGSSSSKLSSNRPTPLDMSAEIEQLDALASATEKVEGSGGGVERKRSVRKVKTPLSYAEPSTKQKLRRGDVLFPKIDADRKLELEAKRSKSGGAAASGGGSPTTDLDRIMSEHFSVSNNKKDGTAPS